MALIKYNNGEWSVLAPPFSYEDFVINPNDNHFYFFVKEKSPSKNGNIFKISASADISRIENYIKANKIGIPASSSPFVNQNKLKFANNNLYIVHKQTLWVMDNTGDVVDYTYPYNNIDFDNIKTSTNGNMYITTASGQQVSKIFNFKNNSFVLVPFSNPIYIANFSVDNTGNIYAVDPGIGFWKLSNGEMKPYKFLDENNPFQPDFSGFYVPMISDKDNVTWVVSTKGLLRVKN